MLGGISLSPFTNKQEKSHEMNFVVGGCYTWYNRGDGKILEVVQVEVLFFFLCWSGR